MELSGVEMRKVGEAFEATQRGDYAMGDGGYFVVATAWGLTEEKARANLQAAWCDRDGED